MTQATHELKTDPDVFQLSVDGLKPYEIRNNDRGYQVGDLLILQETQYSGEEMLDEAPLIYTGRTLERVVTNVLQGYGILKGWAILSVEPVVDIDFNDRFVVVSERDTYDPLTSSGAISWETYVGKSNAHGALERAEKVSRYGERYICRLELVGTAAKFRALLDKEADQ